ncbi:hypothetical protein [Longispora albida]|uniref:hypothetical protein n=1 Tax=Longispora albida TaxID=203523 RepID=UPI0012F8CC61|nr:hypothetical protein [Longispora albida]
MSRLGFSGRLNAGRASNGVLPGADPVPEDGSMPQPPNTERPHLDGAARLLRPAAPGSSDTGAVSVTMAYIGMIVVLMVAVLIGGGNVFAARARGYDVAAEAARAGAQQIDLAAYRSHGTLLLNPGAAQQAARRYLASAGATGTVTVTGATVQVTATSTQRTPMLSAFGKSSIQVTSTASASPTTGGTP